MQELGLDVNACVCTRLHIDISIFYNKNGICCNTAIKTAFLDPLYNLLWISDYNTKPIYIILF